jgi:hypothetical protein
MSTIEVEEPIENTDVDTDVTDEEVAETTSTEENNTDEETVDNQEDSEAAEDTEKEHDGKADETKAVEEVLKQTNTSIEEAARTLSDKGIDYNALSEEYADKGELSKETYETLEKAGYPKAVVDTYIRGLEAANEGYTNAVMAVAGGQAEYEKVKSFVKSKGDAAVDAFNDVVNSGSLGAMQMLLSGLQAEMKMRNGTSKSTILGSGTPNASTGFANEAAMMKAMDDPRYGVDEDYTTEVTKRLSKSKFFQFGR